MVVKTIVAHLRELIQDANGVRVLARQALAFVVDFLDVRLTARRLI